METMENMRHSTVHRRQLKKDMGGECERKNILANAFAHLNILLPHLTKDSSRYQMIATAIIARTCCSVVPSTFTWAYRIVKLHTPTYRTSTHKQPSHKALRSALSRWVAV
jgi:hypothetical protein